MASYQFEDFETVEEFEEFGSLIGVGFLDSMKYAFASGTMTEEKLKLFENCISDMRECINAFDYYSKKQ